MPLTREREVYSPNRFDAVCFWMRDSDDVERSVLCKVSYEALRDRASQERDTNKTFEQHRDQIEAIASRKYDAGQFASGDGDQATIVISTEELNAGRVY